jgi:mRNA-degrading endonuclease RelE of RelBE toxin-antitoxin system
MAMAISYTPEFKRNLRRLAKKYRQIRSDLDPLLQQLQAGDLVGEQIPRLEYTLFKVRVRNRNLQKGKSAGYRVIYYLKTTTQIILVTIYSKSEQGDITAEQIHRFLKEFK